MIGGRILGQGTYGCVFQPALECRGKKKVKDVNMVGKITSIDSAKIELEVARILKTIPNASKYTIMAELDTCTPRSKSRQIDSDLTNCEFSKEEKLEETIQIMMPWGGIPLSRINLHPQVFNFFTFMEDLLEIGTFLVLNDLCHFDIWGQNLLFDKHNTPKLIDFGFTFQPSKLQLTDLISRWRVVSPEHDTETPEVNLMVTLQSNMSIEPVIHEIENERPAVRRLAVICDVDQRLWSNDLRRWTKESQSFQQHDWLRCWKTYWPGFDAWSIGALLLNILELELSIPEFANSDSWKTKGPLVKKILRGLCHGHPVYRIDSAEALNIMTAGNHPLISSGSAGSEWIYEKVSHRPPV